MGSYGGREPGCYLPSFLINERLLVDAGSGASTLTVAEQSKLEGILISHTHLDHVGEIPFIADNIFGTKDSSLPIVSLDSVLDDLHKFLFNNIIWPDFTALASGNIPILEFIGIDEGEERCIGGIRFTPYRVDHNVNAVGYILRDDTASILYSGDTGPTEKIWKKSHELDDLRAIVTEVSFPNFMADIAEVAKHFT
ncbi:3',5'-cyclic-nucleotide phosphodiesterase, partial [Nitrospinota bacterium]